ncbi:PREDICTED: uncharacterized protein LOC107094427 isoform X1 [Cyprinodon variegatus]|uniref:uncharacterized protein LOC107094427 isoform X1 n=1 Tax=Cyprinodon variegatus TaxID=28743 RepID=UPI00074250C0|nr:PREDICTED: uncharacterized protein LOC107094427 isoform X1 [Cyprinodon variegatus]
MELLAEMGISWRTSLAVLLTFLQIQGLKCDQPTFVSGTEGQMFDFRCEYQNDMKNHSKYFCCITSDKSDHLVRTSKHNQWTKEGRVSLYDNMTADFFLIRVDNLYLNDSGMYWCGAGGDDSNVRMSKIYLNVSQDNKIPASSLETPVHSLQLLLIMMCIGAMFFVCIFTICLLLLVKQRRSTHCQEAERASDYETMTPAVRAAPVPRCRCSHPECIDLATLPQPPSDVCPCFTEEHRKSAISCNVGEYVDVDVPGHLCPYQHLEQSQLEEHVYHSLHGSSSPKTRSSKTTDLPQISLIPGTV